MQVINCWEVLGHTNTTDGMGPMKVLARFSSKEQAELYVKSKPYAKHCVQGHQDWKYDKDNIKQASLVILDNADEIVEMRRQELRNKAIAKLSDEEREALGLGI